MVVKYYAGVGSRQTPKWMCEFMTDVAEYLERKGYILRSGGAEGADTAFEKGASYRSQIFTAGKDQYFPMWTDVFVDHFHPAPDRLKPFSRKLMQRNALQVLGTDGNTPVEFVVCWTKDGKFSGGTGQALRISDYYNIPIYNLYYNDVYEKIKEKVYANS